MLFRVLCAGIGAFALSASAGAQIAAAPEGFADLVEALSPAVVNIATQQEVRSNLPDFPSGSPLERFNELFAGQNPRTARSLGSGFVIDAEGVIVTNNHVIEEADSILVNFADGTTLDAEILGRDPATDIAVLRVEANEALPSVAFGDSDTARVGDWVLAIGNPFGLGGSLTVGVISARNRDIKQGQYDDFIQTDASINQGNSGGPLFNLSGEVIGVNTAIFSPSGGSVGISFSAPSNLARTVVDQILEFGETRRGWLGVSIQSVTQELAETYGLERPRGALITDVDAGGPADEAGLEKGDLVVSFNGRAIEDNRTLSRAVAEADVGETAEVVFLREGDERRLDVEVARLEEESALEALTESNPEDATPESEDPSGAILGLVLDDLTDANRREYGVERDVNGALVIAVDPDSDAAGKVRPGDVIEEIAWERATSADEARALIASATEASNRPVAVLINRRGDYVIHGLGARAGR
ncbi:MAG: Do family serine endopeptidase [Maricaulaceae bacterium]